MSSFGGCGACNGRCCRHYLVLVNGNDIAAIAHATGLSPQSFVVLWRDDELDFAPPGGAGVRLVADGPALSMALDAHYDSPTEPRCVFLIEPPDGHARCAVYSSRPAVCASYPFAVSDGRVFVRDDAICGQGSWRITDSDLQSRSVDVARAELGWRLHRIVVAHWNQYVDSRRPRVFPRVELFDYLLNADHRIGQLCSGCSDDELSLLISGGNGDGGEVLPWPDIMVDVAKALHDERSKHNGTHCALSSRRKNVNQDG